MKEFFGSMPDEGSPEYRELVRRQTAVGIPANTPHLTREILLRDGVGRFWVADRPAPVKRPRKSMLSNPVPYDPAPSIVAQPIDGVPTAKPRHLLAPVIVATPVGMPPAPRPRLKPPIWRFW